MRASHKKQLEWPLFRQPSSSRFGPVPVPVSTSEGKPLSRKPKTQSQSQALALAYFIFQLSKLRVPDEDAYSS